MSYLSRIWLNPLRSGTRRLLANPQTMHAAVLGGIPQQPVTERVLWRLEGRDTHRAELLVLTESLPSWEHLVEQAGWPSATEPQAETRDYEPLLRQLARGQQYAFRLQANTVGSTRNPESPSSHQKELLSSERPRGVRIPYRTPEHQQDWLRRRVESWGFEVITGHLGQAELAVTATHRMTFSKKPTGTGRAARVVLQTATFDGRLQVGDAERARVSLVKGVGRGRAYGCGMITLAPLNVAH